MSIIYLRKTASRDAILSHLKGADVSFVPPLSGKVNLEEYSKKLFEKSVTFEAWDGLVLCGLVSAYFNDPEGKKGFITDVSVLPAFAGKGIATRLMEDCLGFAAEHSFSSVELEVSEGNIKAVKLYEKMGFHAFGREKGNIRMKLVLSGKK